MAAAQPPPVILDLRRKSFGSPSPDSTASGSPDRGSGSSSGGAPAPAQAEAAAADPLRKQIIEGLVGKEEDILPGKTEEDRKYKYRRTVPTMTLYSEKGLSIYEQITNTKAYYPFNAEKEILETYGDEIACRMFGLPSSVLAGTEKDGKKEYEPSKAANAAADKEKWGDPSVGLHNYGVNGGLNHRQPLHSSVGLAVELGSGSLDKTRHLLRSMSKLLQPQKEGDEQGVMCKIDYKALDLEAESLRSTLSTLANVEGDCVTTSLDPQDELDGSKKRRVSVSGLHATYEEGLAFLKAQAAAGNGIPESPLDSPPSSPGSSPSRLASIDEKSALESPTTSPNLSAVDAGEKEQRKTSLLWLGSSIGNFNREEAVEFLKGIGLSEGDTALIGIDACADGPKIVEAYNDPEGVTEAFILEGVDVAGRTLGKEAEKVFNQSNFEYVNRWNEVVGRHEAYIRAKEDLTIPLPESDVKEVKLEKGELLQIEVSYKYLFSEAVALFHLAGLRLIQHWTDSSNSHILYLVEKPKMWFPSPWASAAKMLGIEDSQPEKRDQNPYGLPSLEEWEELWQVWDGLMLDIFPSSLHFQKPIPLRHIPLFYVGHIPAFCDIHLSRTLNEEPTEPASYHDLFERGVDPDVLDGETKHWHSQVPTKNEDWPTIDEITAYEQRVRDRVRGVYERFDGKWTTKLARVLQMTAEHCQMHLETAVYIAAQASSALDLPPGTAIPDFPSLSRFTARAIAAIPAAQRNPVLAFSAQSVVLGHDDSESNDDAPYDSKHEFGWDCEHPRREVQVEAYKVDTLPISNGEYLDWLVHSGKVTEEEYEKLTPSSWAVEGGVKAGKVAVKTLWGEVEMQYAREWPVAGSAVQLERFAKDKGGRLPTFPEAALFNTYHRIDTPLSNIGFANLHAVPPTLPAKARDGSTLPATDGGLWMWTSTTFDRWEGYRGSKIYPGYSEDFFDGAHQIVLGGSWASPRRIARPSFVNWYQAAYPYMLGGARVAYDA